MCRPPGIIDNSLPRTALQDFVLSTTNGFHQLMSSITNQMARVRRGSSEYLPLNLSETRHPSAIQIENWRSAVLIAVTYGKYAVVAFATCNQSVAFDQMANMICAGRTGYLFRQTIIAKELHMALETYIVLETRSNKLLARSVDRADPIWIETPGRQKYVENEMLIVDQTNASSSRDHGTVLQSAILSSHVDASFLGLEPLGILNYPEGDSKFEERLTNDQWEEFDEALELKDAGEHARAGKILRSFLSRFPFHIDTYQHLGVIEYMNNRKARAFKYFEMGYRIGMESVLQSRPKLLPWGMTDNRPFLRAAHSYALGLSERKRYIEAIEIYEQILAWNPNDNQGIRFILPSEYVEAHLPSKAKVFMDAHGADGMNVFTRCLIEVLEGHFDEAIRWLCQGLCYNVHFPSLATGRDKQPLQKDSCGLVLGSREEASDYLKYNPTWNQPLTQSFLRKVLDAAPIANRIRQVFQLHIEIASHKGADQSAERVRLIEESYRVFDQQSIRKILRELQALSVF